MMHHALLFLAAAASVSAAPQTFPDIAPAQAAPPGCEPSTNGKFQISIVEMSKKSKRDSGLQRRGDCSSNGILVAELHNGVVTDAQGRTGYIASNYQFQFDKPPQVNAIYTAGFSHCSNGSLALGGSTVWYQCRSGNFYNLYDRYWAAQCSPVEIMVMPCGGEGPNAALGAQNTVGTQVVQTTVVVPLGDGQPQVVTTTQAIPICQIDDGQIQGHTTPCAALTPVPNVPPVSQASDGQIQATFPASVAAPQLPPVSQATDGQPQATTAVPAPPPVSQATDGQPQVTTAVPQPPAVSQATDGQPQVTTAVPPPPAVTQATDGQPQVTTALPPVSQAPDGQPQVTAPAASPPSAPPAGTVEVPSPPPWSVNETTFKPSVSPTAPAVVPPSAPGSSLGNRIIPLANGSVTSLLGLSVLVAVASIAWSSLLL